jgi:hypothetical protein
MKKKVFPALIVFILTLGFLYLLWGFVELSLDPHKWTENARNSFAMFSVLIATAAALLFANNDY